MLTLGGAGTEMPPALPALTPLCTCPGGGFIAHHAAIRGSPGDGPDKKETEWERGPKWARLSTTYSLGPMKMSPCMGLASVTKSRSGDGQRML